MCMCIHINHTSAYVNARLFPFHLTSAFVFSVLTLSGSDVYILMIVIYIPIIYVSFAEDTALHEYVIVFRIRHSIHHIGVDDSLFL